MWSSSRVQPTMAGKSQSGNRVLTVSCSKRWLHSVQGFPIALHGSWCCWQECSVDRAAQPRLPRTRVSFKLNLVTLAHSGLSGGFSFHCLRKSQGTGKQRCPSSEGQSALWETAAASWLKLCIWAPQKEKQTNYSSLHFCFPTLRLSFSRGPEQVFNHAEQRTNINKDNCSLCSVYCQGLGQMLRRVDSFSQLAKQSLSLPSLRLWEA